MYVNVSVWILRAPQACFHSVCVVLRAAAGVFVLPAVEVEGDEFEDVIKDQRGALQVDDWGRQRRMNDFLLCVSVCTF